MKKTKKMAGKRRKRGQEEEWKAGKGIERTENRRRIVKKEEKY
jgi:hypothetical protein